MGQKYGCFSGAVLLACARAYCFGGQLSRFRQGLTGNPQAGFDDMMRWGGIAAAAADFAKRNVDFASDSGARLWYNVIKFD